MIASNYSTLVLRLPYCSDKNQPVVTNKMERSGFGNHLSGIDLYDKTDSEITGHDLFTAEMGPRKIQVCGYRHLYSNGDWLIRALFMLIG